MSSYVIYAFLEYQENFAPGVCSDTKRGLDALRPEAECNITRGEDVACKAAHSLNQIMQTISIRVDGPDNIAHRVNQFTGSRRDRQQGLLDGSIGSWQQVGCNIAQNCDLGQPGADIVVKVGCDARSDPLQPDQLGDSKAVSSVSHQHEK